MFDDLEKLDMKHKIIDKTHKAICDFVKEIRQKCIDDDYDPVDFFVVPQSWVDHMGYDKTLTDEEINGIANILLKKNYFVKNRYNKYYVVAFALNYTRFEIFSKDCDKQLIDWEEGEGEIKGVINDLNYNENPVVTLLKQINEKK
jgi:hypothetical protein